MKVLVTGGAGFIGRWIVKRFLEGGHQVCAFDDLSNGSSKNIEEFVKEIEFVQGDVRDRNALAELFKNRFDVCVHAAAQINVQSSIDQPEENFAINVAGSENVLRECHRTDCKLVHLSSCMVYDISGTKGISEEHRVLPKSPYAASKLAADYSALAYHYAYEDRVVVLRPFNTYGPFQRTDSEGGVVSIFVRQVLGGKPITVYGNGRQTRDLLYVEDCAEFIYKAATSNKCNGMVLNAGFDRDIKIIDLARLVAGGREIKFVDHPHPQSEIRRLLCDSTKARSMLRWKPKTDIKTGVKKLTEWMANQR